MKQKQHFMINDINYVIGFGKHSGKSIKRIYQGEPVIRQSIKSKLYTVLNSWIKDRKLFDHIVENDLSELTIKMGNIGNGMMMNLIQGVENPDVGTQAELLRYDMSSDWNYVEWVANNVDDFNLSKDAILNLQNLETYTYNGILIKDIIRVGDKFDFNFEISTLIEKKKLSI